jgi:uncharacterized membrane protein
MKLGELISLAAHLFEAAGVGVMVAGAFLSLYVVARRRHRESGARAFRHFRQKLGRSILLGLELLVAADIIRTVSEEPHLEGVLVLGIIVLIRTFLSFTLAVELEGHWPWQRSWYVRRRHHRRPHPPRPLPPQPNPPASEERPASEH